MSNPSAFCHNLEATKKPTQPEPTAASAGDVSRQAEVGGADDPRIPILLNLSTIRTRMDSLQQFLSNSVNNNILISRDQMQMVSSEIASAVDQIILNGATLLGSYHHYHPSFPTQPEEIAQEGTADLNFSENHTNINKIKEEGIVSGDGWEIIELSAAQLLGARKHYCDLCGKEFKRYANLRIHIRAHENQFKTSEEGERSSSSELWKKKTRFSCPFVGCDRNKLHGRFSTLKSVVCAKNHYRRSHCPKMYSCTRCNKKSFSVLADLKSHFKHCGESNKFRCSCGTSFSRRDKLLGHMVLFKGEGHVPAVATEEDEKAKGVSSMVEDEEGEEEDQMGSYSENGFFMGLLEEFCSIDKCCSEGALGSFSTEVSAICNL